MFISHGLCSYLQQSLLARVYDVSGSRLLWEGEIFLHSSVTYQKFSRIAAGQTIWGMIAP